jgi:hypothetical protein
MKDNSLERSKLGPAVNAGLGWWWADPVAGLVIVYYALREEHTIRPDLRQT